VTKLKDLEKNCNGDMCHEHDGIYWFNAQQIRDKLDLANHRLFFELLLKENKALTDDGILVDS